MSEEKSYLKQVSEFHKLFDHPIEESPVIPSTDRVTLRLELILEELTELAQASGEIGTFKMLLNKKVAAIDSGNYLNQYSPVECLDAFCDIQYVLSGGILEYGMHKIFNPAFNEVQRSNMSKACTTEEEALLTCDEYDRKQPESSFDYKEKGDVFLVFRVEDAKTVKSIGYSPAQLEKFI
jgi:predicted HAD superfamily Cof-like phosphohydrolase